MTLEQTVVYVINSTGVFDFTPTIVTRLVILSVVQLTTTVTCPSVVKPRHHTCIASYRGHSQLCNVTRERLLREVACTCFMWKGDYFAWVLPLLTHADKLIQQACTRQFCWTNTPRTPVSHIENRI